MCLAEHATVTICHSRTEDLAQKVAAADVVIAAVGRPEMVKGDWIKKGAVVIDVGVNRVGEKKLVGDVDFDAACENAAAITPVPGGVGPMTITMLLFNTLVSAKRVRQKDRENPENLIWRESGPVFNVFRRDSLQHLSSDFLLKSEQQLLQ